MKPDNIEVEYTGLVYLSKDCYFIQSLIDEDFYLHRVDIFSFITTCIDTEYELREGLIGASVFNKDNVDKVIKTCGIPHLTKVNLEKVFKPDYSFN